MRSIIALIVVLLASTVSAGSIRPDACLTTTDEDNAFKTLLKNANVNRCKSLDLGKTCTDAEAKAVDPTATIYLSAGGTVTNAVVEDYLRDNNLKLIAGMIAADLTRRGSQDISERWLLGTPEQRAAAEAALPELP